METSVLPQADVGCIASIVIPAHDEERVIGRLLTGLTSSGRGGHFEITVVCNGCTDATADIARSVDSGIRVIERETPSKHDALRAGNAAACAFPRLFVDADVEIDAAAALRLVQALDDEGLLAVAPRRCIPRDGVSWIVKAYYDVWEQLPSVRDGLFGRGVIALSRAGFERLGDIPQMMGDDLVISEAFAARERAIIEAAVVTIHPPRTLADLHRRRVRAATGNAQADEAGLRQPSTSTSARSIVDVIRHRPRLALRMPVFLAVSLAGRIGARRAVRRGDFTTWGRDESSRG